MLLFCTPATLGAQGEPPLAVQIRQALKDKEPSYRYIAVIQSGRVPIVPSERRILASQWERKLKSGKRESIGIYVYQVESPVEAKRWLNPLSSGQVASGWHVSKCNIGDEGYLAEFQNRKQFEIKFRKGNVVAEVSGQDLRSVERFAKYVAAQLHAI